MPAGLKNNQLVFEFPDVHADAELTVTLHRTLRIPDDGSHYGLPPSLGHFPLRDIDSVPADRVPEHWPRRGGVVMPMWQAEAMWISFSSRHGYPFAVKIAAGKVNAVNGKPWKEALDHQDQDFVQVPRQPWIDGFCVSKGVIKQFVAMPLGAGYSVEEQVTGKAEHGGVQILVYPLSGDAWNRKLKERRRYSRSPLFGSGDWYESSHQPVAMASFSASPILRSKSLMAASVDMGLGAGGRMKQEIHASEIAAGDWSADSSKCFVAIANSLTWRHVTGDVPPHPAPTAADYAKKGLPWFEYYGDGPALGGAENLAHVKSVKEVGIVKGEVPLPENGSFDPTTSKTVKLGRLPRSGAKVIADRAF
jgi:hypothetical protein